MSVSGHDDPGMPPAADDAPGDPAMPYLLGPGREDYLRPGDGPRSIPILLNFSEEALRRKKGKRGRTGAAGRALRAAFDTAQARQERFGTVVLRVDDARALVDDPVFAPERALLDGFLLSAALPVRAAPGNWPPLPRARAAVATGGRAAAFGAVAPAPTIRPDTVVVGIIDDGLPFAHERFRRPDGTTRIHSVWLQDGDYDGGASGFPYGRQLTGAAIDAQVAKHTHAGVVDEEAVYRQAGVMDFTQPRHKTIAARGSHGAHVMDSAAGFAPPDAPDWVIVAVQLPIASTEDTSGASLAGPVRDAFDHIRQQALAMANGGTAPPVVINFSYGFVAGPHDGTSFIERAIDEVVASYNAVPGQSMRVVLPAGNSHLARAHAVVGFDAIGRTVDLPIRTLPDDRTPSFVELWLPSGTPASSRLEVSLVSPLGGGTLPLGEGGPATMPLLIGGELAAWVTYAPPAAGRPSASFIIGFQPTFRLDTSVSITPTRDVSPHGRWVIRLRNVACLPSDRVHAWIQRDDTPYGYPVRGRQAYFEDDEPRFDAMGAEIETDGVGGFVRRAGSINAIATGRETIVAGALVDRQMRPARYSAGGPLRESPPTPASRSGPDALVTADTSVVHAGTIASGTRSGSSMILNGTSVAAPRLTRWIAGELAAGRPGDRVAVTARAQAAEAAMPPGSGAPPAAERGGAGRLALPAGPRSPRDTRIVP